MADRRCGNWHGSGFLHTGKDRRRFFRGAAQVSGTDCCCGCGDASGVSDGGLSVPEKCKAPSGAGKGR